MAKKVTVTKDQLIDVMSRACMKMTVSNPARIIIGGELVELSALTVEMLFDEEGEKKMVECSCEKGFHAVYGDTVKDSVTGYVGKVTAKCDFYGRRPTQYLIESIDSTDRPIEWWVDNTRLSLFKEEK